MAPTKQASCVDGRLLYFSDVSQLTIFISFHVDIIVVKRGRHAFLFSVAVVVVDAHLVSLCLLGEHEG